MGVMVPAVAVDVDVVRRMVEAPAPTGLQLANGHRVKSQIPNRMAPFRTEPAATKPRDSAVLWEASVLQSIGF